MKGMDQNKQNRALGRGTARWQAARMEGKVRNVGIKNVRKAKKSGRSRA